MFEAAPESAAQQCNVDFHTVGIEPDGLRHRIAHILRHLGRRPDFTIRSPKMCNAIARLHRSMRHEWELVLSFDASSGGFGCITYRVQGHGLACCRLF